MSKPIHNHGDSQEVTPPEPGETAEPTADSAEEIERSELDLLAGERDKLQDQLQRTLADLQNFRKRRAQEMADVRRATVEAMSMEMLPVLDNFHLATDFDPTAGAEAMQSMRDGLQMVRGMLESVFERHGVQEIPAAGATFDPNVHEAVGIDPDPEAEDGKVTQIIQRGYQLDGKVIRPSRVMVGGAPPVAASEDSKS